MISKDQEKQLQKSRSGSSSPANPPGFLSLAFHTSFFPGLIRDRLGGHRKQKESYDSGFSSNTGYYVVLIICFLLIAVGLPDAISHRTVIGWVAAGIGAAGIVALLINGIVSCKNPPSYEYFLTGVFFFFVTLGITTGVFIGTLEHSLSQGLLAGAGGLIAGYFIGILAGLWFQHLGWLFSGMVNSIAWFAVLGMFFVDLVLLTGRIFG